MHEIDEAVNKYNTLLSSDNFYSCPRMEDDPEDTSPEGLMTIITSLGDDRESFYTKQVKTAKYFETNVRDYDYDSLASQLTLTLGYANVFSDYYKIEKVGDDTLTTSFYYSMTFRLLA
ncbi:MAG: hypothetical protein MJ246_03525 [Clostridia bacterium]|nr:hypothetical protein [Clostridia bacterium]